MARYDIPMGEIESKLRTFKEMEKQNATEQEEKRMERVMIEMQLHMKKKEEHKAISSDCNVLKVKLPKLVISRFDGTHINWSRFWNQFESEIDRSELHAVSQFSLFKELIPPRLRVITDGLSFTTEGYTRAKEYLDK